MHDQDAMAGGAAPFSPYEFQIALRYLRTKRKHGGVAIIAVISTVGIALAVFALIAVMSVMNGFRHELMTQLLGSQPHLYADVRETPGETVEALVVQIEALDGVATAGPVVVGQVMARSQRAESFLQVLAMRPMDLERLDVVANGDRPGSRTGITHGSIDTFGEGRNGGDAIVLGAGVARFHRVNIGDQVTLLTASGAQTPFGVTPRRKAYTVTAILSSGVSTIDNGLAILPVEQAQLFFNRGENYDRVNIRVEDTTRISEFLLPIQQVMGNQGFVYDYTQSDPAFFGALQMERTMMRLVMSFIVVIATMNIISGLVMLVKNKSRDIAILRTMGITRLAVMRVFIIVGALIGMIGTLAGIVLGFLFVTNIGPIQDVINLVTGAEVWNPDVYYLYRIPARLDWGEVIYVSIFCFVMSVLVTLPPAILAALLDPVEALRYE